MRGGALGRAALRLLWAAVELRKAVAPAARSAAWSGAWYGTVAGLAVSITYAALLVFPATTLVAWGLFGMFYSARRSAARAVRGDPTIERICELTDAIADDVCAPERAPAEPETEPADEEEDSPAEATAAPTQLPSPAARPAASSLSKT